MMSQKRISRINDGKKSKFEFLTKFLFAEKFAHRRKRNQSGSKISQMIKRSRLGLLEDIAKIFKSVGKGKISRGIDLKWLEPYALPVFLGIISGVDAVLYFNAVNWAVGLSTGLVVSISTHFLMRYWKDNWSKILHWTLATLTAFASLFFWTSDLAELPDYPMALFTFLTVLLVIGFIKPVLKFLKITGMKIKDGLTYLSLLVWSAIFITIYIAVCFTIWIYGQVEKAAKFLTNKEWWTDHWRAVLRWGLASVVATVSVLFWIEEPMLMWHYTLMGIQWFAVFLLIGFLPKVKQKVGQSLTKLKNWFRADWRRRWITSIVAALTALIVVGYLTFGGPFFWWLLGWLLLMIDAVIAYRNMDNIRTYLSTNGKKAFGYLITAIVIMVTIIMFGKDILDFFLNNIGWFALAVLAIIIISNWSKIKNWQWVQDVIVWAKNANFNALAGLLGVAAVVLLFMAGMMQKLIFLNLSYVCMVGYILFRRIYKSRVRLNQDSPNFVMLVKEVVGGRYAFVWTPMFVLISSYYLIFFVISPKGGI